MEKKISHFGYELIRTEVLKNILGKNANELLYWAGKELVRNHKVSTLEEVVTYFDNAGWGTLSLVKQGKDELTFNLTGELVEYRIQNAESADFNLETGFLAAQMELSLKKRTEAICKIIAKKGIVEIIVKSDLKDDIEIQ